MLTEPLIQQLQSLRLPGMAAALTQQLSSREHAGLSFDERLSLLIQHETTARASARLAQRLRLALQRAPLIRVEMDPRTSQCAHHRPLWRGQELHCLRTRPCRLSRRSFRALLPIASSGR